MAQESYCSFEVAKLLEEKGFEQHKCQHSYDSKGRFKWSDDLDPYECSAPTHQMAMAWLREAHNVSIEPFVDYGSGDDYWWTVDITKIKKNGLITELSGYKSYEEAVEAALKYYLGNFIY